MSQVIRISEELYERLGTHAEPFESPASVIERIINAYEGKSVEPSSVVEVSQRTPPNKLEVVFYPSGEEEFKSLFLVNKVAWVLLQKSDGSKELKQWTARKFTNVSSVMGNLRSGYLRDWKKKGIVKAEVAINKQDITQIM